MHRKTRGPKWWLLDMLLVAIVAALLAEGRTNLSLGGHEVAEIAIVLAGFVAVGVWLNGSAPALYQEQRRMHGCAGDAPAARVTVYRKPGAPKE